MWLVTSTVCVLEGRQWRLILPLRGAYHPHPYPRTLRKLVGPTHAHTQGPSPFSHANSLIRLFSERRQLQVDDRCVCVCVCVCICLCAGVTAAVALCQPQSTALTGHHTQGDLHHLLCRCGWGLTHGNCLTRDRCVVSLSHTHTHTHTRVYARMDDR